MRRFDDACLTPIRPLKPGEIKAIRERENVSQSVFGNYLNVTSGLVSKWERGEERPSGISLKLLSLVEKNGLAAVASSHQPAPVCESTFGWNIERIDDSYLARFFLR